MFLLRMVVKLADIFVQKHVVVSEHLLPEMKLKKPIIVQNNPVWYAEPLPKKPHKGFNILYYQGIGSNQVFMNWLYGKDVVGEIKNLFPELNFIEVSGSRDMKEIYPIIDFYLRPNRHDGDPRMVRECILNNIPYYHSWENPNVQEVFESITEVIRNERL